MKTHEFEKLDKKYTKLYDVFFKEQNAINLSLNENSVLFLKWLEQQAKKKVFDDLEKNKYIMSFEGLKLYIEKLKKKHLRK